jgi:hypothetical protein
MAHHGRQGDKKGDAGSESGGHLEYFRNHSGGNSGRGATDVVWLCLNAGIA